ncbi:MAG: hypothetical protein U0R52_11475 [Solirubrobacterales bacterium]
MSGPAGRIEAIFVSPRHEELPEPVGEAEVVPARGIRGDRYFAPEGREWRGEDRGHDLTLIEAEAIEALGAEHGITIEPAEARRQVLTRGVDLNALVGRRFTVGALKCEGFELCEPCSHLEGLTRPGVLKGLVHRGGLRADVLGGGTIRVGDPVVPAG